MIRCRDELAMTPVWRRIDNLGNVHGEDNRYLGSGERDATDGYMWVLEYPR